LAAVFGLTLKFAAADFNVDLSKSTFSASSARKDTVSLAFL